MVEELKEIKDELKQELKNLMRLGGERLKNPLVGSFAISWLVINWKIIVLLIFSKYSMEVRIRLIEVRYSGIVPMLLLPLALAVIYIVLLPIILPYIRVFTDKASLNAIKGDNLNAADREVSEIESRGKVMGARLRLENDEKELRALINTKDERKDLQNQISELQKALGEARKTHNSTVESLKQQSEQYLIDLKIEREQNIEVEKRYKNLVAQKDHIIKEMRFPPNIKTYLLEFDDNEKIIEYSITLGDGTILTVYQDKEGVRIPKHEVVIARGKPKARKPNPFPGG